MGYRHIDCAYIYENEAEVGEALATIFAEGIVQREDLFITGKLWNSSHSPAAVRMAAERSLRDLGLTYMDLYLVRRHPPWTCTWWAHLACARWGAVCLMISLR